MFLPQSWLRAASLAAVFAAGSMPGSAQTAAQPPSAPDASAPAAAQAPAAPSSSAATAAGPAAPAPPAASQAASAPVGIAAEQKTYTVPSGTKVLLQLRSAINTKSAKAGDAVYLSSTFPVVVGNRVMIPEGVYVQGMIDRVQRGGRVKGKAQLDMHFTAIVFPNGTVAEVPGVVDNLPGAKNQSVKNDDEGTIEQNSDKGRHAGTVAEVGIPTGGTVGSIAGLHSGHPLEGGLIGLGAGAAAAGIVSLFTRGADVDIPAGTQVEMVLQRPLILEQENLAGVAQPGTAPTLVPVANQPKPIAKRRPHILCPAGGLGCD